MANRFNYPVTLIPLDQQNKKQEELRPELIKIPYLLYKVEDISDGRKIVINKPGGKRSFGRLSKDDFMVFIFTPKVNELWLISHSEIYEDIVEKLAGNEDFGISVIGALKEVCNGVEPNIAIKKVGADQNIGLPVELILKAYKWIWGQEDCNYPNAKGRWLSMNSLEELISE